MRCVNVSWWRVARPNHLSSHRLRDTRTKTITTTIKCYANSDRVSLKKRITRVRNRASFRDVEPDARSSDRWVSAIMRVAWNDAPLFFFLTNMVECLRMHRCSTCTVNAIIARCVCKVTCPRSETRRTKPLVALRRNVYGAVRAPAT